MEKLSEKNWDEFSLEDIFTVSPGKRLETRNKILGNRPFIGATESGNGVTGFVGNDNVSKDSNVLGVNYNGAPCIAFYHPYECIFTDDVKRLHMKHHPDDENTLLFFAEVFAGQRSKYSYGYKFKEKRMLRQKLMLPINDSEDPDFDYMAEYTKQMREKLLAKYREYAEKRIAELGEEVEIPALGEKEWKPVRLSTIMDSFNSKAYHAETLEFDNGDFPYVTRTAKDNGLYGFVVLKDDMLTNPQNVISFGAETAEFFYQPYSTITGNKMYYMTNDSMNEFIGLFIEMCLRHSIKDCFSYANGAIPERVMRKNVMLPVTDSGEPDYEYMEQYAKNMMLRKYRQYMTFFEKKSQKQTNI